MNESGPGTAIPSLPVGADTSHLDVAVLADLVDQIGGQDGYALDRLIDTYLGDAAPRVAAVVAAADEADAEGLARAAHGLRSGSALFGAVALAVLLQQSEILARAGEGDLAAMGAEIEAEYRQVAASLQLLRPSL
jgi:HPt (histidine-containing phosphotransfer) domain-containing protein